VSVSGAGVTVSGVSVIDSAHIAATLNIAANAAPGPVNVTVAGSTSSVLFTVTAAGPVLSAISPATGTQGATVAVTLTGSGFATDATVSVSGAGVTVSGVSVIDSAHIAATLNVAANAAPGPVNVTVSSGGRTTAAVPFTVLAPAPVLSRATPSWGNQGATVAVTLTGSNFAPGVTVTVPSPDVAVSGVRLLDSSRIAAVFTIAAAANPGLANITVSSGGRATATLPFTIAPSAPALTSISPAAGEAGRSIAVVLTGSGFAPGARLVFSGPGITPGPITVVNANRIEVTLALAVTARSRNIALAVSTDWGNSGTAIFTVLPAAKLGTGRSALSTR
jgi:hypothetical protein